jgi:hypothetical protein
MFGTCDGDRATETLRWAAGLKSSVYLSQRLHVGAIAATKKRNRGGELVAKGGVQGSEDARNPHIPASAAPVS